MASGSTRLGTLDCVFFSEFHPEAGPKITHQVPEDFMSRDDFDVLSSYFIPKPELLDKMITINAFGKKIIGCPIGISNAKYSRNALLFNVCFVCSNTINETIYKPLIKKLASYLTQMEVESGLISNEETRGKLPSILKQLYSELNSTGKCSILVDDSNTIHLKLVEPVTSNILVLDHHVPTFLGNQEDYDLTQWDLATQQILPNIDGINHVKGIAMKAGLELNVAKICLQNLIVYGVIKIIPVFQYMNVYLLQPEIYRLYTDKELQDDCIKYVTLDEKNPPTIRDILQLYCSLEPGTRVRDLCMRHKPRSLGVDERHLIQFGVVRGLIRRLVPHPVKVTEPGSQSSRTAIDRYLQGQLDIDEICCVPGITYDDLDDIIQSDDSIHLCWK